MATRPGIPAGASAVIPRLFCRDIAAEIDFCQKVLGAVEVVRRTDADGKVLHALLTISGQMLMLEAEVPTLPSRVPPRDGSSPVVRYVYLADIDEAVARSTQAGAKLLFPPQNQFWGDRIAWIMDPEGHVWTLATRIEETSSQERDERWETARGT